MLLLLLLLKLALMWWAPSMHDRPLFDPSARLFDLGFFVLAIVMYAIHAPLQEFVVRVGMRDLAPYLDRQRAARYFDQIFRDFQ